MVVSCWISPVASNLQGSGAFSISQVQTVSQQCLDCTCREGPIWEGDLPSRWGWRSFMMPGDNRGQAVGKHLSWLCCPRRCCFPWHQMHSEIGSRKDVRLAAFVLRAYFLFSIYISYCLSVKLCIKEIVLISLLHTQAYFSYLLGWACSQHRKKPWDWM